MNRLLMSLATVLLLSCVSAFAQSSRSYDEGSVLSVSSIRVKDGQWDNYMAYLAGPYKRLLEEQKKAGIILAYDVFSVEPRSPSDPNLYLTVTYANMAALDGLEDKMEPLATKVLGESREEGAKKYADRATMREVLGSQLLRALVLR